MERGAEQRPSKRGNREGGEPEEQLGAGAASRFYETPKRACKKTKKKQGPTSKTSNRRESRQGEQGLNEQDLKRLCVRRPSVDTSGKAIFSWWVGAPPSPPRSVLARSRYSG